MSSVLIALLVVAVLLGALFTVWAEASGKLLPRLAPVEPILMTAEADGLDTVEAFLRDEFHVKPAARLKDGATRMDLLGDKREMFERVGTERDYAASFHAADADGVPGEWTVVEGSNSDRRLLYLHGGGFTVGSSRSHRAVTVNLAKAMGAVVFAPDYRLMPENKRLDSLADTMTAYRWILDHGPGGEAPAGHVFVAGDSAGGSLTLALLQQARDAGLRPPDAAVGFSPSTDYTVSGPNIRTNYHTDTMLQPLVKPMLDAPRAVLPFAIWKAMGARPTDPRISPLWGDLHDLPPTLIQVAKTEMLYDDALRYAAKAHAAGSPIELEVWEAPDGSPPLPHVWVMFDRELPAARQALDRAAAFMTSQVQ